MSLISLIILCCIAPLAPVLTRASRRFGPLVVAAVPFGLGCWFTTALSQVGTGEVLFESIRWLPEAGLTLSFRLDGLSLAFALLICFIGSLVLLYAGSYLEEHPRRGYFLGILTGFMAAMLGLVLADNLIMLFVFWELTSILSFLLIGFDHERESARRASLQALLVTGLGGLALLAGLVLLGVAAGGFEVADVLAAPLHECGLYTAAAVLLLLGAFTKSAIFPFHFWLPNAMEAPSPVSALLHSATMVKAGVYLIARLHPAMTGDPLWDNSLAIFGGITMVLAAFAAPRQTQLKKILAYSTISSLGTLVMLIGLGAAKAAATYLIAHALFKGCLFLVAGTLTKRTGQKDPDKLGGLISHMPVLAAIGIAGALSMAGMFPFFGFVGKELLLKAGLHSEHWTLAATVAVSAAGLLTVMAALVAGVRPFIGRPAEPTLELKPADWRQLLGPGVLAALGLIAGLAPTLFAEPLVGAMRMSIDGGPLPEETKLRWLGLLWPPTAATYLSIAALVGGGLLYLARARYRAGLRFVDAVAPVAPERTYFRLFDGLMAFAGLSTRLLQNGSLQAYVRVTLCVVVGVSLLAFIRSGLPGVDSLSFENVTILDVVLALAVVAGAIAAIFQRTALASVAALGATGFALALVYAIYGAPDVATTQFAVETLIVIIFVLVIFHLPRYSSLSSAWHKLLDFAIAGAVGLLMAGLVLAVLERPAPDSISSYYAENSVPSAFGRNVVNVILVDFRALDTLGEVFVVGVAAMGVFTLLRLRSGNEPRDHQQPHSDPGGAP
ncbi:MAG: hydrogen gas-evolving membrane-bound hydrogenase subunit E [Planctomycetota bacterium]